MTPHEAGTQNKNKPKNVALNFYSATVVLISAVVLGVEAYFPKVTGNYFLIVVDWFLLMALIGEVIWRHKEDPIPPKELSTRKDEQNPRTSAKNQERSVHIAMLTLDWIAIVSFFVSLLVGWHIEEFALLRVPRILMVVHVLDIKPLREFTAAILHSLWNVTKAAVVVMVHFYIYAVIGTFLFRDGNSKDFGNLGATCVTLMHVNTGVGYQTVLDHLVGVGHTLGIIYFASYFFIGITLLIGIVTAMITNDVQELRNSERDRKIPQPKVKVLTREPSGEATRYVVEFVIDADIKSISTTPTTN